MGEIGLKLEMLDREGVRQIEASVDFDCIGGAFYAQDAHIDPACFVRGLAANCVQRGLNLHERTEVLRFRKEAGAITADETTRGDFEARDVVLCSGSWSPGLATTLDMVLPMQPAKGYSVTVRKPDPCPETPLMMVESKVAITPMGDKLRFAGTLELAGMDLSINRRRVAAIMKSVPQYVPAWDPDELELIEVWRGLRPCSPDGLPYLGRSRDCENLTVATGHAMIGVSLGPVTGDITARLVQREAPIFDLDLCRVERFE